jgi:hypothetical protein
MKTQAKKSSKFFGRFLAILSLAALSINLISCSEEDENVNDIINPYVVTYNPVSEVNGIDINSNLILTFDNIVYKGIGNITLTTDVEEEAKVIDVLSDKVTISNAGRVVTINPDGLLSGKIYYITLDPGFVLDAEGNEYFGMPDNEAWNFTTGGNPGDTDGPEFLTLLPADEELNAGILSLALEFSEEIRKGAGQIIVYSSAGVVVSETEVAGDNVIVDGNTLLLIFNKSLDFATDYYVNIAPGVIKDFVGNDFVGFSDSTSWNFTTTAGSGSDLVVHLPMDSDLNDISGNLLNAHLGATATADYEFVDDPERGNVIHFPSGSYASLPKHNLLRPAGDQSFTVNFWVKVSTAIGSDPAIIGNSSWDGGSNQGWVLALDGANEYDPSNTSNTENGWTINLANGVERTDWEAGLASTKAPNLADGNWHMVTMVIDHSIGKLKVYTDGIEYVHEDGSDLTDLLGGALYDEVSDLRINLWEDGKGNYNAGSTTRTQLDGYMDEMSYYNRALTMDEINNLLAE